jgi:hypothetical protein
LRGFAVLGNWAAGENVVRGMGVFAAFIEEPVMDDALRKYEELLGVGAKRLTGHQRRLFQAEVCLSLCEGNAREAESRFG